MSNNMQIFESMKNPSVKIKMEKREESINNLVANTDYIEWLNEFTLLYNDEFYQYNWDVNGKRLPKKEQENVMKLGDFYNKIFEYATKNGIKAEERDFFTYLKVKYQSNLFHIGMIKKTKEYFCSRQYIDDGSDYLDIENVINDKTNVDKKLEQIDKIIISLHEDGVPYMTIENSVNKSLIKIKEVNY